MKELEKVKVESEGLKRDQRNAQDKFDASLKRQVDFKNSELDDERKSIETLRATVLRLTATNKVRRFTFYTRFHNNFDQSRIAPGSPGVAGCHQTRRRQFYPRAS